MAFDGTRVASNGESPWDLADFSPIAELQAVDALDAPIRYAEFEAATADPDTRLAALVRLLDR